MFDRCNPLETGPFRRPAGVRRACRLLFQRSFTLLELMVTISIIAIVAALAFPSLQRALHTARNTQCVFNLHELGQVIQLYVSDNGFFPPTNPGPQLGLGSGMWYAPSTNSGMAVYGGGAKALAKLAICPENKAIGSVYYYAYCANQNVMIGYSTNAMPVRAVTIFRPSQIVLLSDSTPGTRFSATGWNPGTWGPSGASWSFVTNRHGNLLNILCVDGHVAATSKQDLSTNNFVQ